MAKQHRRSNTLHKVYAPVSIEAVRDVTMHVLAAAAKSARGTNRVHLYQLRQPASVINWQEERRLSR